MNPILTIICAVYNSDACLKKNLKSLLSQNLQNVEIIYVNDGSLDNTEDLLRNAERENFQIKIVSLSENRSASYARKIGFEQSKGDYIWFIDADDEVAENAIEDLLKYLNKYSVDILHFNTQIVDCGAGKRRCNDKAEFDKPNLKYLENEEILEDCFIRKGHGFNLWNKVFSRNVCKIAMEHLEDGKFFKANDLYLYFLIAFFAHSYQGIDSKNFYYYFYGSGSTGHDTFDHEQFILMCQEYKVLCALERFVQKNYSEQVGLALFSVRCRVLNDCIVAWKRRIPQKDKKKEFLYLLKYIGAANIVFAINHTYFNDLDTIIADINDKELFCQTVIDKTNIALFIPDNAKIVWDIIQYRIQELIKGNKKFFLITDDEECCLYFEKKYKVFLINKSDQGNKEFFERVIKLSEIIKSNSIGEIIYINYMSSAIFYDCLLSKALNVKLNIFNFEYMFSNVTQLRKGGAFLLQAMKLADSVETFYQSDVLLLKNYDIDVFQVRINKLERKREDKDYYRIIWEGAFQNPQYNFYDLIEIMERLVKLIPNVKLDILCHDATDEKIRKFQERAKMFNVSENICLHIEPVDDNYIYHNADICLVTSSFEIFPKIIFEAVKFSLPVVAYEQICIEEFYKKVELITVQQRDFYQMANSVKDVILNRNLTFENKIEKHNLLEIVLNHYKWGVMKYKRISLKNKKLVKNLADLQERYCILEEKYSTLQEKYSTLEEKNSKKKLFKFINNKYTN